MASELIYTSARKGLRPGTSGFCTVAHSRGMSAATVRVLESLSAYCQLYPAHDARASANPVAFSHYRYVLDGRGVSVISRVGFVGADHTNRTSKIAHHIVLDPGERPVGGPAWLAAQPGILRDDWEGEPRTLDQPREMVQGDAPAGACVAWEAATGDAGWAGVLAAAFERRPTTPAFVVFEPGTQVLPLLAEALALIPPRKRWRLTFNTFFTALPAGTSCLWRCCVPAGNGLRDARRLPRTVVLDLTQPCGPPPETRLVLRARTGAPPDQDAPAAEAPGTLPRHLGVGRPSPDTTGAGT